MRHRHGLSILLSAIIVLTGAYSFFGVFHAPQLPFSIQLLDGHTAVIGPAQGIPFPNDLRPGDLIDLAMQPRPTRVAIDCPSILQAFRRAQLIHSLSVAAMRGSPSRSRAPAAVSRAIGPHSAPTV